MSDRNGTIHEVPPPGFVNGFCTTCKKDRVVPEATLACMTCGAKLHPDSLPPMRSSTVSTAVLAPQTSTGPDVSPRPASTPVRAVQPPPTPKATVEVIALPDLPEAGAWFDQTLALAELLDAREAALMAELRKVRQFRKLIDANVERVAPPMLDEGQPADVVSEIAVETIDVPPLPATVAEPVPPAIRITPRPITDVAARVNGGTAPAPKRWALKWDACWNCGADDSTSKSGRHGSNGRCIKCDAYWRAHGKSAERPVSRES